MFYGFNGFFQLNFEIIIMFFDVKKVVDISGSDREDGLGRICLIFFFFLGYINIFLIIINLK